MAGRLPRMAVVWLLAALAGVAAAQAQDGPPNALQGFSQNRDKPVKIDAATLEVHDKDQVATFAGNVQVVQGDTMLRCRTLAVYYDRDGGPTKTMTQAQPGPNGQQRIRRLEARGGVIVTQKDQTATGDLGVFDMASNTVTLSGNVVVTQGQNVLRGERLVVDLTNGVSHVEGGKGGGGRVQGLFLPSQGDMKALAPGGPKKPAPAVPPRESSSAGGAPAGRDAARPSGLY